MFYSYKKIILSIFVVIIAIIMFIIGVTFGSPTKIVQTNEAVVKTDDQTRKINEDIDIVSSEGNFSFVVRNSIFSKSTVDSKKKISFDISIKKKESETYLLQIKDEQNQDIQVKYLTNSKEQKTDTFEFIVKNEQENSKLYLFVYPISKEKSKAKKIDGLAYSKILFDVKEIKQKTIDSLK